MARLCGRVCLVNLGKITNASVLLYSIASEIAANKPEVTGPGTFLPAFIDALNELCANPGPRIENLGKISLWEG